MKTKIISVVNKKGGVGKSTTVSAISSICASYGLRVLNVDLDPQINTTAIFYNEPVELTITDLLIRPEEQITYDFVKSVIKKTPYENIDIIPGDMDLDDEADKILLQNAKVNSNGKLEISKSAQMLLTKVFNLVEDEYDLILIDNTPYFNIISRNAMSASNGVLIPVENDGFSYYGLARLLTKIYEIKGDLNEQLDIIGVFFTNVNTRTTLYKQLRELFQNDLKDKLLNSFIRHDNSIKESNTALVPLYNFSPKGKATLDYMQLIDELNLLTHDNAKQWDLKEYILNHI